MSARRFTATLLSSLAVTAALGGCDDYALHARLGAPRTGFSGGGLAGDTRLVGVWSRIVYVTDASGQTHSSQTTWAFEGDGDVRRTIVATNLTAGISDAVVADGVWRTEGRDLLVDFAGTRGVLRIPYDVDGDRLDLGGLTFIRVVS